MSSWWSPLINVTHFRTGTFDSHSDEDCIVYSENSVFDSRWSTGLQKFYLCSEYSDISIVSRNETLPAHSVILCGKIKVRLTLKNVSQR